MMVGRLALSSLSIVEPSTSSTVFQHNRGCPSENSLRLRYQQRLLTAQVLLGLASLESAHSMCLIATCVGSILDRYGDESFSFLDILLLISPFLLGLFLLHPGPFVIQIINDSLSFTCLIKSPCSVFLSFAYLPICLSFAYLPFLVYLSFLHPSCLRRFGHFILALSRQQHGCCEQDGRRAPRVANKEYTGGLE